PKTWASRNCVGRQCKCSAYRRRPRVPMLPAVPARPCERSKRAKYSDHTSFDPTFPIPPEWRRECFLPPAVEWASAEAAYSQDQSPAHLWMIQLPEACWPFGKFWKTE